MGFVAQSPAITLMPTTIGVISFAIGMYCLLKREDWLLGLLFFSALFLASSWMTIGDFGIQPYYLLACIFLLSWARKLKVQGFDSQFKGRYLLTAFAALGIVSAFLGPLLFAGTPVYPREGLDEGFWYHPPLRFGLSNLAQAVYLLINALVVWAAAGTVCRDTTRKMYTFAFYFLVTLVFIQFICLQLGIEFPYSLIQNNPGYYMAPVSREAETAARVVGTFTEPSGVGAALVFFYAGFLAEFLEGRRGPVRAVLAACAIAFARSSGAIVAVCVVTLLAMVCTPVFRFPSFVRVTSLAKVVGIALFAAVFILSPLGGRFTQFTLDKADTESYLHRTAADLHGLQVAADTHWIGVGLGSNRPSSLVTSLLSTVGISGLVLFLVFAVQVARNADGRYKWMRWSLLALLIDLSLSGPDINLPTLWSALMLIVAFSNSEREEAHGRHRGASIDAPAAQSVIAVPGAS